MRYACVLGGHAALALSLAQTQTLTLSLSLILWFRKGETFETIGRTKAVVFETR